MDNQSHLSPLIVRWFYALLTMKYGWLYGSFVAAGLLTALLLSHITAPSKVVHQSIDYESAARALVLSDGEVGALLTMTSPNGEVSVLFMMASPITQVAQLDAIQIETPREVFFQQGDSVQATITSTTQAQLVPWSKNGLRASEIRQLPTPVSTKKGSSLTTLEDLAKQFRADKPTFIVANLNCSGFEQKPGEQRVLYIGQSLAVFPWIITATAEGPQRCNLMVSLEGIPFGSNTSGQLQIFADTWPIDVEMPPYVFGAPIALYASLYAFLVGVIGALATKVIPWCYTWMVSRRKPEKAAKKPARARSKSTRARRVSR